MKSITIDGIVFKQVECACQLEPQEQCAMHRAAPELLKAAKDALESLRRLHDANGAYRVSCIFQLESAIRHAGGIA